MAASDRPSGLRSARLLVLGLVVVILVLGLAFIGVTVGRAIIERGQPGGAPAERPDALANSSDSCVTCHRSATPGIVDQYGHSAMAAAKVTCRDCHEVEAGYPGSVEHEGDYVLGSPTPAKCQRCHGPEVAQFYQSRHSLPAYVAYAGAESLSAAMLAMYQAIPEGQFDPDKTRHALYALENPDVTPFACVTCHSVGTPRTDGSVGECQKCHLRHEFSLEQARKPETCNACHIGPDHPQWEIYQESAHGIAYATGGDRWNWSAAPGTLTVRDLPAPTCATCHLSGFGASGTTHDVGNRLTWYLFAPSSVRRPDWQSHSVQMQNVCHECHNETFIQDFYQSADKATEGVNGYVKLADAVMAPLNASGLITAAPFDEPIDFKYFDLWHYWGRTSKFGIWMQGPDYTQWHGIYELLKDLSDLKAMAAEKITSAPAGNVP
jgi:hypothetical protein